MPGTQQHWVNTMKTEVNYYEGKGWEPTTPDRLIQAARYAYGDRVAKSASLLIAGLPGTKPNKITDQLFTDDGLRTVFAAYRVRR